jgi:hypothetical protein
VDVALGSLNTMSVTMTHITIRKERKNENHTSNKANYTTY